ncbi:MAG: hypothetical protein LC789_02660 [Actinobacteria bacterium]|nr:hypothetical protein [Actinomycetota bacterium]MCA1722489.1 hypothetical protein [Actinomycetota bacterium]
MGFVYPKNAAQQQAALGSTVDPGNPYRYEQILVKDINARGGIAGRKLLPVYHGSDAASTETAEQRGQAACSAFTEDDRVFAALPFSHNVYARGTLECLRKAGAVAGLASNVSEATNSDYNAFPENFDVSATSMDRMCANLIPTLVRGGYFSKWDTVQGKPGAMPVKVGILAPDLRPYRDSIKNICLPALARAGFAVDPRDVYFFYFSNTASDNGRILTDIQSAGLKFKSDGVTHVIPVEQNGMAFFGQNAENQKYYPRYGVNSHSGTQVYNGIFLTGKQLNGAVGLGYLPSIDLPEQLNPDNGPYSSDARRQCVKLMKDNGQTFGSTSAQANALALCDVVYTLKRIIEQIPAGSPINASTYAATLATLGDVPSANVPAAFLGQGHLDAITLGWQWQYFADCQCMHYNGNAFKLS